MKTKLNRFKVYNFRSIEESNWIEVSENSCLVGTNEAGKTNLLIALWKLNPANDEPIVALDDFPRHLYSKYKADNHSEDVFIAADFLLSEDIQNEIYQIAKGNDIEPRDFFKILYQIILSTTKGPKIGPFIMDIGRKNVAEKLNEYI